MQNAQMKGRRYSNSRGNLNSSIGAGDAQRAALDAAMPIAGADAATYSRAADSTYASGDKIRTMGLQSFLGQNDTQQSAQAQDWLNNNTYNREFNGKLAMMPIANAADMWQGLMTMATGNPEIFTPEVLTGYQTFFQSGFDNYISKYLGGAGGGP